MAMNRLQVLGIELASGAVARRDFVAPGCDEVTFKPFKLVMLSRA